MEFDDLKEILRVFREEAREIAERMTGELLALESAASEKEAKALLESLFRGAHTIKGGAGSLGMEDVVGLSHTAETLLGQCQRGERKYVAGFTDALLAALDEIGKRLDAMLAGQTEVGGGIAAAQSRLMRVIAGEADVGDGAAKETETAAAALGDSFLKVGVDRIESFSTAIDELLVARLRIGMRAGDTLRLASGLDLLARRAQAGRFSAEDAAALRKLARDAGSTARELSLETQYLGAMSDDLRENIRSLQVVPASTVLDSFRRSVRDHARKNKVDVALDIVGSEVSADRRILEGIRGALVHLLRNAVDHAIESPSERKKHRKPPRARIRVDVSVAGSQLTVSVTDDGRGIDPARLREKAIEKRLVTADEAKKMPDEEALTLIWRPGFSTAEEVTETSGRGVGLDAVRDALGALGGRIDLQSKPREGTTFRLAVPLMLAAATGLVVEALGSAYVIPLASIEIVKRVRLKTLERVRGVPMLNHASRAVPVVSLGAALTGAPTPEGDDDRPMVCVVSAGDDAAALTVDRVQGEREIAIRPLTPELQRYEHLAGATRGADGRVVLVLSAEGVVRRALQVARTPAERAGSAARTILVVDDAVTSRLLYRGFLEAAGFRVLLAGDGEEALEVMNAHRVDAVISDVRMPRMDGIELTRRIRRIPGNEELPVLLCTSLGSEEDRREGLVAGATAYLVKQETPPEKLVDVVGGFVP